MPQTPQPDADKEPRIDKKRGFTLGEDVPSAGRDIKGEHMIREMGGKKLSPNLTNPQPTKESP